MTKRGLSAVREIAVSFSEIAFSNQQSAISGQPVSEIAVSDQRSAFSGQRSAMGLLIPLSGHEAKVPIYRAPSIASGPRTTYIGHYGDCRAMTGGEVGIS